MPRAQDVAEARADVALSPLEANALAKTSQAVGGALKFVNVDLGAVSHLGFLALAPDAQAGDASDDLALRLAQLSGSAEIGRD